MPLTKYSIQKHYRKSHRSSHLDLRILDPRKKKRLWSWALVKERFPEDGEKLLAIRTPDHRLEYMYFEGELENRDKVTLFDKGICDIIHDGSYLKIFYFKGEKINGAYNFIRLHSNVWLVTKAKK